MRPLFFLIAPACLLAAGFALAAAPAADPTPQAEVKSVEGPIVPELTVAEIEAQDLLRDLTIQRNTEIETALVTVRMTVEQLQARLAATASPSEQLALQRATENAKTASQIEVMRIQARYADLAGKPERATQMREEAMQMEQVAADRNQAVRR